VRKKQVGKNVKGSMYQDCTFIENSETDQIRELISAGKQR